MQVQCPAHTSNGSQPPIPPTLGGSDVYGHNGYKQRCTPTCKQTYTLIIKNSKFKKKKLFLLSILEPLADVSKFHFMACLCIEVPPCTNTITEQQQHWFHGGFSFRKAQRHEAKIRRVPWADGGPPHRSLQMAFTTHSLAFCSAQWLIKKTYLLTYRGQ